MSSVIKPSDRLSRLILEEMEPRRLFSGGVEGLVPSGAEYLTGPIFRDLDAHKSLRIADNETSAQAEQRTREIVFVDAGVEHFQQFVDDVQNNADDSRNIEVVVLDRDRDGIEQISSHLQDLQDIDAVHIISHGVDGSVKLGETTLNADSLQENSSQIALWANAFTDSGDILFYGCDLASSSIGQNLIDEIGALTLTDVAASDDLTGADSQGGDWLLEYNKGKIESSVAVSADLQQEYRYTLGTTAVDDFYNADEDLGLSVLANGVMANDLLPDPAISVSSVEGSTPAVGTEIALTSGALLTLNADGSFSYDTNGMFEYLGTGVGGGPTSTTDSFVYTAMAATGPSTEATVTITITGVNDAAVITGTDTGSVTEDSGVVGGFISTSATLTATDVDTNESSFTVETVNGTYGDLNMDAAGNWTYSAANGQAAIQQLAAGETLTDNLTVHALDGTAHIVSITINGANDAPTISDVADIVFLEATDATAQDLSASGTVSFDDIDSNDVVDISAALTTPAVWSGGPISGPLQAQLEAGFSASVTDAAAPGSTTWDYTVNDVDLDFLASGETITLTFTITATDSSAAIATDTVTITINGVNETPLVLSASGDATVRSGEPYTLNLNANQVVDGWIINWGDGNIETIASNPSSVDHIYTNVGVTYNITVAATDSGGVYLQNELLVAGSASDAIYRYEETSGTFLQEIGAGDDLNYAADVAVGPDGLIYVSGYNSDNVLRYNATTGAFVDEFVSNGLGGLNGTLGIEFGTDGNLYVASSLNGDVLRFDGTTGAFIDVFIANGSGGLDTPEQLLFGTDGNLYVSDYAKNNVLRFDGATGAFIDEFVSAGSGGLDAPEQMAFGPDGNLYVASDGNSNVLRFNGTTGAFIDEFVSVGSGGLSSAIGLAFGPDGNLYIGSWGTDNVLRYQGPGGGSPGAFIGVYASGGGLDRTVYLEFLPSEQVRILDPTPLPDLDANDSSGSGGMDFNTAFTEDGPAVLIADSDATITNVTNLTSLDVTITNQLDGTAETLAADTTGTSITASYNSGTGVLSLSGLDSVANYQQVLRTITYSNSSQVPNTIDRTITFVAWLNSSDGNVATTTVAINAVDDPAIIGGDTSFTGDELDPVFGTLTATDIEGLTDTTYFTITSQTANGTAAIDSATGAWTFTPTIPDWFGVDNFTVTVTDDLGGTTTQVISIMLDTVATQAVPDNYSVNENATLNSTSGWIDNNWLYRRTLSFDNSSRTENLLDFPVLIKLDGSNIDYAKTHDSGDDLRFFDQDGTLLAHEIEVWNESGTSYVWVKVPQIDASSDTDSIVMYYGNAGVVGNGQDAAGVWSNYQAVYHLNENPGASGTVIDSAGNHDGTNADSTDTAGVIGNAQDFDGSNEYINLGDDIAWLNNASGATLSIWTNSDSINGASNDIIGFTRYDVGSTSSSRFALIRNSDEIRLIARTMDDESDTVTVQTTTSPLVAGQWQHITGTVDYASDVDNIKIYVDGVLEGTFSHNFTLDAIPNTVSNQSAIGSNEGGVGNYFDGQLDEARILLGVQSEQAIAAQYAAMTDSLVTVGFEQTVNGVLANDYDREGDALSVIEINGDSAAVGFLTVLPSGANLTLNTDGSFVYDTNSAFESLGVGDSTTDSYTYRITDGNGNFHTATVTITINGSNDAATVSSASQVLAETDAALVTGGTLTSTDVDNPDNAFTANTIVGAIGDLTIDAAGAWTFTANSAFDSLNVGDSVNETFSVSSVDGTLSTVTITINGSNDAATVSSASLALTETDAALMTGGTLTSTDVDNPDNAFTANTIVGTIGDLTIDAAGAWTFTANSAFDILNVGDSVNETFSVSSVDGTLSTVQITINGSNDAATVSSASLALTETDAPLSTGGTLTSTDVDNTDNAFTAETIAGTIGDLTIDAAGAWTFTANSAFDTLNVGDSVNETFNVSSVDGTASTVQITINGSNDAATASSASLALTETDAPLSTGGTLTSTDVDNLDNTFTPANITGAIGTFAIDAAGAWTFTANSAFDTLNVGDSVNETFNVSSVDGTASTVQIQINGSNDAATVSSDSQVLIETDAALVTGGTLTSSDVDNPDDTFTPVNIVGAIGTFNINAAGVWTFTANSAFDNLNVGDNVNETFNVTSVDGTATTVQIQINGTNDAATVSSASQVLVETDAPLSTGGTLTSTDVDNPDNTFTPVNIVGTIGTFDIDAAGVWTFTANSAFDNLNVGDNVNETFNVTSVDGTASTVQIQINGTNDAATVSSASQVQVETDAPLSTGGTLTSVDVDNPDNTFTPVNIVGTIGTFDIDAAGVWTFTANSAFDSLNVGDNVNETFNVTSVDGTASTVQIQINGTNDAATVSSDSQALIETDAPLVTGGTLTSTDVDNPDDTFTPVNIVGTIGTFDIDAAGVWTFTANSAFDSLNVGDNVNETFNVTSVDGTASTVQIQINGSNDAATVSSASQVLVETDAPLSTGGTLTSVDVDNPDATFTPVNIVGTIGTFDIDAAGVWTFTANSAFDNLNVGDNVNETFNVTSVDGTASTVQIQINGSNDAATVSSASLALTETDAPLSTGGTLTSTDVDNPDNAFTANTIVGAIGDLTIDAAGAWTFTANSAFDTLNVGDSVNETFSVSSVDGTLSTVTITINGSNDAATVSSASLALTETDVPLSTGGTLTSTDVDNPDNAFTANTIVGAIGDLTIDAAGAWTFTANSAFDTLNVGDSVNETFNVTSVDGTLSTVQITINGSNDAATVSSASLALTETDAPLSTGGTLTSTDVDNPDNAFTAETIAGTIGDLTIDAAGAWSFTANNAFDSLNVGDNVNETFNVTSVDGTATTVQIQINGSNDAATVSSDSQALIETDAPLVTGGTLTSTDVDNPDDTFTPVNIVGTIGTFDIDAAGVWTFTANSAFDSLNVGDNVNETFNVTSVDGTASTVQIQINGSNDAATVSSDSQVLIETDAALVTGGTLTSSDVDNPDATFTPANIVGTIGTLDIDAAGVWAFTANSAFDNLNVGDNVNETFNLSSVDGTASTVQITINGTNDTATVSSASQSLAETDAALVTGGTLTSSDVDNPDDTFTPVNIVGAIGTFNINAAGVWTFTANSAFDNLNVGDNVNETFNVTSVDGTATTVQIQINGTNDAATVSSASQVLVETDAPLSTGGTLTSTDVDNPDNTFTPVNIVGTIGTFDIDAAGVWTFTANSAFDNLNVGDNVNETFNVTSVDGTASTVQIQINGTNDATTVSSASQVQVETDAPLSTGGTLTSVDVDNPDATFTPVNIVGTIGTFNINAAGVWTFTANSAFDNLNVGDNVNETFNVTSVDGTASTVQIQINGTNDAATVSSDSQVLVETDAPLSTGGTLTSVDVDNPDATFTPVNIVGTIGTFDINAAGVWTFTANSAFDNLNVGDNVNETFNITSVDGTASTVQIQINGTNDAPVALDVSVGTTENTVLNSNVPAASDVDGTIASYVRSTTVAQGILTFNADGSYSFDPGTDFDDLVAGATRDVTFTYTAIDNDGASSGEQTVIITVTGTNNLPIIGGTTTGTVFEDVNVVNGMINANGKLTINDPDTGQSNFIAATVSGTHGVLNIDAVGNWSYSADNTTSTIQSLHTGETLVENLTVTTADGSTHDIIIRINGTEESEPPTPITTEDPDPPPAEEEQPYTEQPEPPESVINEEVQTALEEFDAEEIYTTPQIRDPNASNQDPDGISQFTDSEPSNSSYTWTAIPQQDPVPAQEFKVQGIDIDSLRFAASDDEDFNASLELALLERIEQMSMAIDSDASGRNADNVEVQVFIGATTSLTAGIVSWVLRGGSLLASLMGTAPLLNRFDPLPILKSRNDKEDVEPDDDDDTEITGQVGKNHRRVDNMFNDNKYGPSRGKYLDE